MSKYREKAQSIYMNILSKAQLIFIIAFVKCITVIDIMYFSKVYSIFVESSVSIYPLLRKHQLLCISNIMDKFRSEILVYRSRYCKANQITCACHQPYWSTTNQLLHHSNGYFRLNSGICSAQQLRWQFSGTRFDYWAFSPDSQGF